MAALRRGHAWSRRCGAPSRSDVGRDELLRTAAEKIRAAGAPYTSVYLYMLHGEELVLEAYAGRDTDHTRIPVGHRACAAPPWPRARIRTCPTSRAVGELPRLQHLDPLRAGGAHPPRRPASWARSTWTATSPTPSRPRRRRRSAGGGRAGRPAVSWLATSGDRYPPDGCPCPGAVGVALRAPDRRRPAGRGAARRTRRASRLSPPGFDALADGRELIYYDQRGGGRSAVPRDVPVGWTEQVADLEALRAGVGASTG